MNRANDLPRRKLLVLDGDMLARAEAVHTRVQDMLAEKYPDHETVVHDATIFCEGESARSKFVEALRKLNESKPYLSGESAPVAFEPGKTGPLVDIDYTALEERYAQLYPHQVEAMERINAMAPMVVMGIPSRHQLPVYKSHRLGISATPMVWDSIPDDFKCPADDDLAYKMRTVPRMSDEDFARFNRDNAFNENFVDLERYVVHGGRRMGRQWARDNLPVYQWNPDKVAAHVYASYRDSGKTHLQAVREILAPVKKRRKVRAAELERIGAAYEQKKKVPNE